MWSNTILYSPSTPITLRTTLFFLHTRNLSQCWDRYNMMHNTTGNKIWHITQHGDYLQIFASETLATEEPWVQKVWGRYIGRKSIQDVQTNSWSGPERWESKLLESWPAVLAIRSLWPHYSRSPAVAHKLCIPYLDERDHKPLTSSYHRMESMTKKFT